MKIYLLLNESGEVISLHKTFVEAQLESAIQLLRNGLRLRIQLG